MLLLGGCSQHTCHLARQRHVVSAICSCTLLAQVVPSCPWYSCAVLSGQGLGHLEACEVGSNLTCRLWASGVRPAIAPHQRAAQRAGQELAVRSRLCLRKAVRCHRARHGGVAWTPKGPSLTSMASAHGVAAKIRLRTWRVQRLHALQKEEGAVEVLKYNSQHSDCRITPCEYGYCAAEHLQFWLHSPYGTACRKLRQNTTTNTPEHTQSYHGNGKKATCFRQ